MGPKKQGLWPRINCSQMKLPNFVSPSRESSSKIWHDFSNKVGLNIKLPKTISNKKCTPKLLFFIEKKLERFGTHVE